MVTSSKWSPVMNLVIIWGVHSLPHDDPLLNSGGHLKILSTVIGSKLSTELLSCFASSQQQNDMRYMTAYFLFSFSLFFIVEITCPQGKIKNKLSPHFLILLKGDRRKGLLLLFLPVVRFTLYLISRLSPWLFVSRWKNLARISLYPCVVFHSSKSRSVWLWHSSNARLLQTWSSFFGATCSSSFAEEGLNNRAG